MVGGGIDDLLEMNNSNHAPETSTFHRYYQVAHDVVRYYKKKIVPKTEAVVGQGI